MQLPKRKTIRLKDDDYSENGMYFITICAKDRLCWFGEIINSHMKLSEYGYIIQKYINEIPKLYKYVEIDKYCIMPNHIHIIVLINKIDNDFGRIISAHTISTIIGSLKRAISKEINFSIWQKSFHDHIIRNEKSYQETWQYIENNPLKYLLHYK